MAALIISMRLRFTLCRAGGAGGSKSFERPSPKLL